MLQRSLQSNLKTSYSKTIFSSCIKDLLYTKENLWKIFNTLIRSILEYVYPIFINLPTEISLNIESIQKRAHKIICGYSNYKTCTDCVLPLLKDRRTMLSLKLFKKSLPTKNILYQTLFTIILNEVRRLSYLQLTPIDTGAVLSMYVLRVLRQIIPLWTNYP